MTNAFQTSIEVRFGDCDPAGIVYYPTLYHYCHVAFEEAWGGALGVRYADLCQRDRIGFPTVHVETDFRHPARYGDALDFTVWVSRVGATSVVFEFAASAGRIEVLRSSHTKVCTDLDTLTKRAIPDAIRARLEALDGTR